MSPQKLNRAALRFFLSRGSVGPQRWERLLPNLGQHAAYLLSALPPPPSPSPSPKKQTGESRLQIFYATFQFITLPCFHPLHASSLIASVFYLGRKKRKEKKKKKPPYFFSSFRVGSSTPIIVTSNITREGREGGREGERERGLPGFCKELGGGPCWINITRGRYILRKSIG